MPFIVNKMNYEQNKKKGKLNNKQINTQNKKKQINSRLEGFFLLAVAAEAARTHTLRIISPSPPPLTQL
jgi:hypothetical protein